MQVIPGKLEFIAVVFKNYLNTICYERKSANFIILPQQKANIKHFLLAI